VANRAEFTETLFLKCGTEMGRDSKKYCSAVMHGCTFAGTEMRWDSKYYFQHEAYQSSDAFADSV
jgi:hypothetical protein